jgi:phytoene desaturase
LAAAGYEVDIFDKQPGPGGKAFVETLGGYRFDTGPSLVTMPWVFEDLFDAAGRSLSDYLTLVPLETICTYFWSDAGPLRAYADIGRFAAEMERVVGEPAENVVAHLEYCRKIEQIAGELFLTKSLHEASTLGTKLFWRSLLQVAGIDPFRTMAGAGKRHFRTEKARQLFNRYATYNGSSPYRTPATLNIVPSVEYYGGAFAVRGGIYAIPQALDRLAKELGVRRFYSTTVEGILTDHRRAVRGLQVSGETIPYDLVVSDADAITTYEKLLGDREARDYRRYRRLEPSSSGLVYYWGISKPSAQLDLHNIFFSDDYPAEFADIFDRMKAPEDPTVYVNITSRIDPEDAPGGGENWFVLINAPHSQGQDWASEVPRLRKAILSRVGRTLGFDVGSAIEVEGVMTPEDIEAKTDSHGGSLYGISSNSVAAAFSRHRNRSRRYRGLFLCGGSTHPGGGMPLVILSGRIVSELILRHHPPA